MVQLFVRFTVAPERVREVLRALESVRLPARLDRDSQVTYAGHDDQERDVLIYIEEWADQAHLLRRVAEPSFSRLLGILEDATAPPLFEVRFLSSVKGIDYVSGEIGRLDLAAGQAPA